jgi:Na+/H+-dicarboxylate symporter
VITGVAGLGSGPDLGRLGGKTLAFYVITTLIAVLIALTVVNLVEPGIKDGEPARNLLALTADAAEVTEGVKHRAETSILDTIRGIVPPNIVEAAANTKLLALVFFAVLFGFFLARIEATKRDLVLGFWQGIFEIMMRMTSFVMLLAPIGVFALIAKVVAVSGLGGAGPLLLFGGCVLAGLALYGFVALPILLATVARVNPWRLFPAMAPALLTAFSTASSSATLPLSLQCLEKRANVSERIAGFVMPLGASVNHAGSALYECAAAMFIAQAYGLHLSFGTQFTVVVLALITSMGIAGIPAASLVGIAIILAAVGLPAEAIGVLLVLDRLLDMARTAINVLADAACAVIVARLEGETEVLAEPTKALA